MGEGLPQDKGVLIPHGTVEEAQRRPAAVERTSEKMFAASAEHRQRLEAQCAAHESQCKLAAVAEEAARALQAEAEEAELRAAAAEEVVMQEQYALVEEEWVRLCAEYPAIDAINQVAPDLREAWSHSRDWKASLSSYDYEDTEVDRPTANDLFLTSTQALDTRKKEEETV